MVERWIARWGKNGAFGKSAPPFEMLSQILLFESVHYNFTSNSHSIKQWRNFRVFEMHTERRIRKIPQMGTTVVLLFLGEKVGQYCGTDYSTWKDLLCEFFFSVLLFYSILFCFVYLQTYTVCVTANVEQDMKNWEKSQSLVCLVDRAQVVSENHWH